MSSGTVHSLDQSTVTPYYFAAARMATRVGFGQHDVQGFDQFDRTIHAHKRR